MGDILNNNKVLKAHHQNYNGECSGKKLPEVYQIYSCNTSDVGLYCDRGENKRVKESVAPLHIATITKSKRKRQSCLRATILSGKDMKMNLINRMNVNDKPKKNDGEAPLQAADKRPQRCVSSIESSAGSGEKIVFGLVQPVPSLQTINLPPKPTHSPPPVPINANNAGSLHPSISDELVSFPTGAAPPKPPRMKKETRESYNAYDNAKSLYHNPVCHRSVMTLFHPNFSPYFLLFPRPFPDDPMPCEVTGAFGLVPSSAPPPQPLSQQQSQQSDGDVRMRTRGWFEEIDDEGNSYFSHPDSADQKYCTSVNDPSPSLHSNDWFSALMWVKTESEDGKVYYYERGSRRSVWDLPNVEPCGITSNATGWKRPTSTLNDHLPSAPVSSITPGNINTIDLSEAQAKFGARKLLPSMSGDSLSPMPAQDESSSRFYRVSKDHITGPIENKLRGTERRGQVTFTRCSGGRSIKKAIACILVLSGPTLYIYKESKNQSVSSPESPTLGCGLVTPIFSRKVSESGMKFLNLLSFFQIGRHSHFTETDLKHLTFLKSWLAGGHPMKVRVRRVRPPPPPPSAVMRRDDEGETLCSLGISDDDDLLYEKLPFFLECSKSRFDRNCLIL
ncbi:hypothetical protein ACTXT7_000942 [Hymenolepis weldensis]